MNSKTCKSSGKSRKIGLGTAVAVAMGVSSGLATANTDVDAADHEILPDALSAEYLEEALLLTAGNSVFTSQSGEDYLMVADRAFGLGTATSRSGRTVPPSKKSPPKKKPPKKSPPKKKPPKKRASK
ncbi:MAG: hypothetical protein OEY45_07225 [Gammaproteobacteria bacterium]|nr:hypothetical protein [Gammaproteobacteria bacterium]